ncbi:MAG: mechanosensitive ion channel family protein [Planctomycetota bacterium]|jgi:small-conductance mechanosensitive channel
MRLGLIAGVLALFAAVATAQDVDTKISVGDLKKKIAKLGPKGRGDLASAFRSALEEARKGKDEEATAALEKRVRAFFEVYKSEGVYTAETKADTSTIAQAAATAALLNEKALLDKWATGYEEKLRALKTQQDTAKADRDAAPDDKAKQATLDNIGKQTKQVAGNLRQVLGPLRAVGLSARADALAELLHTVTGDLTDLSVGAALGMASKAWETARTWIEDNAIAVLIKILLVIVIYMVFKFLARLGGRVTNAALSRSKISPSELLKKFFVGIVSKGIMFLGLLIILGQLGIDVGPVLAGISVVGFIVGFALKDTLANFAAGIMILMYRPFDAGNVISACGIVGKVDNLTLVSTTLLTPDNQVHIVPNGAVWGGVITNITANDTRRVDMTIGVGYDDDLDAAEALLLDEVKNHPKVLADPAPIVKVAELADSSVNFVVRPWSKTSDYWDVKFDLSKSIKKRLDKEGFNIPFPQRDVHVYQKSDS